MTLDTKSAHESPAAANPAGPGPEQILQMATGYWVSKTLFTGLELGVFEALNERPQSPRQLAETLDLPYDGSTRLLTALTALGLLERRGEQLAPTAATAMFLVKDSPQYMAGIFDHFNHDLYPLWRHLTDSIREGTSRWQQAFGPDANPNPFETIYRDPQALRGFMRAMDSLLMPVALELREQFDFSPYRCLRRLDTPRLG